MAPVSNDVIRIGVGQPPAHGHFVQRLLRLLDKRAAPDSKKLAFTIHHHTVQAEHFDDHFGTVSQVSGQKEL
jgi:hypothetical protein